jgi:hypothetical protein
MLLYVPLGEGKGGVEVRNVTLRTSTNLLLSFLGPKWHTPIGSMPFLRARTMDHWICTHPKHYARAV